VVIGVACGAICLLLLFTTPKESKVSIDLSASSNIIALYKMSFPTPQIYLSGIVTGLLFVPFTVFAMTWAISFLVKNQGIDRHTDFLLVQWFRWAG